MTKNHFSHYPFLPSPHFNERPTNITINTIVLHNISLPPNIFGRHYIDHLFLGTLPNHRHEHPYLNEIADLRVSAHFFIARDGEITQYVNTNDRAWHAGISQFCGQDNCNDFSIGIEINGSDHHPYTLKQYQSLVHLIQTLMQQYPAITKERITTHSNIAPTRKTDPGPAFKMHFLYYLLEKTNTTLLKSRPKLH